MGAENYHEAIEVLRPETRDMHRAISSLMEELEAVDWYDQRIDATDDPDLARILAHNRDEEKEHAAMVLEWIRRKDATFDEQLRRFLFKSGPITEHGHGSGDESSLSIGSLRHRNQGASQGPVEEGAH